MLLCRSSFLHVRRKLFSDRHSDLLKHVWLPNIGARPQLEGLLNTIRLRKTAHNYRLLLRVDGEDPLLRLQTVHAGRRAN